jgi:magnesium-dependent phosphatase 1
MYELTGGAPFRRDANGRVWDAAGTEIKLMGASRSILTTLSTESKFAGVQVAYVSRTEYPEWAVPCLKTFMIDETSERSMFDVSSYHEIYPGCKRRHFKQIKEKSGISFAEMLFFDNEFGNIRDCSNIGIVSIYTPNGMTADKWEEGLREFARQRPGSDEKEEFTPDSHQNNRK